MRKLVAVIIVLLYCEGFAGSVQIGEYTWSYSITDGQAVILGVSPNTGNVQIPDTITDGGEEYQVTSIGDNAFQFGTLTEVIIPDGVTSIGVQAFYDCSRLESVAIPGTVTSIGSSAFLGTKFYESQPDGLVVFGKVVYKMKGSSPTVMTVPEGIVCIGDYAFENCTGLTHVTIPSSVTSIGMLAFWNCSSLTSVTIPDSVTSIGQGAFCNCSGLTSVTIPNRVTSIGRDAFADTPFYYFQPNGLVVFGKVAYKMKGSCPASVVIPDGIVSITDEAFFNCSGLSSVTLPNGIESVGEYAFSGCTGLSGMTLPHSVKVIGYCAFSECSGLTQMTIPSSVAHIAACAFENCTALADVTVGYGVRSIGPMAFNGCTSLTNIAIPASVTSIGGSAFQGCRSLLNVTIPSGVTDIYDYTFSECGSLTSITIPGTVTNIWEYAFSECRGLASLTIPDSVTTIKYDAFFECSGLTNVIIGSGVTSIGNYAFAGCRSLQEVYLLCAPPSTGNGIYYRTPSTLTTYVPEGSTGWVFPNIAALPEEWPRGDSAARAIAYGSPGVIDRVAITWKLDDGTVIDVDDVPVGLLPTCSTSPAKPGDAPYIYTFTGWNPSVETATTNATYTASFEKRVDLSLLTGNWTAANGDVLVGTTSYRVDIPAGATITMNGVMVAGASSCSPSSAAFSNDGVAAITSFVREGDVWRLTAFAELSEGTADGVDEDMVTVLSGNRVDSVTNRVAPSSISVKNAIKAEFVIESSGGVASQFYKVIFGK